MIKSCFLSSIFLKYNSNLIIKSKLKNFHFTIIIKFKFLKLKKKKKKLFYIEKNIYNIKVIKIVCKK